MSGPEYGVLFSHAPEAEISGGFRSVGFAKAHGSAVAQAQPGVEFELMYRDGSGEWLSVTTAQSAAQVTRERWDS